MGMWILLIWSVKAKPERRFLFSTHSCCGWSQAPTFGGVGGAYFHSHEAGGVMMSFLSRFCLSSLHFSFILYFVYVMTQRPIDFHLFSPPLECLRWEEGEELLRQPEPPPQRLSRYLVILLQDAVHLCDVFARNGFDYEAMVIAAQEAVAEATLGVAVERGAPGERVLPKKNK